MKTKLPLHYWVLIATIYVALAKDLHGALALLTPDVLHAMGPVDWFDWLLQRSQSGVLILLPYLAKVAPQPAAPDSPGKPAVPPAAVVACLALFLCLSLSGCAGVSDAMRDINKTLDSLPAGSIGSITVEHHDIYGSGGITLMNGVKGLDNSAAVGSIDWHETYPVYQPHVNLQNFVRLGKDGKPPPAPTMAPVLVNNVPVSLMFQAGSVMATPTTPAAP